MNDLTERLRQAAQYLRAAHNGGRKQVNIESEPWSRLLNDTQQELERQARLISELERRPRRRRPA